MEKIAAEHIAYPEALRPSLAQRSSDKFYLLNRRSSDLAKKALAYYVCITDRRGTNGKREMGF